MATLAYSVLKPVRMLSRGLELPAPISPVAATAVVGMQNFTTVAVQGRLAPYRHFLAPPTRPARCHFFRQEKGLYLVTDLWVWIGAYEPFPIRDHLAELR